MKEQEVVLSKCKVNKLAKELDVPSSKLTRDIRQLLALISVQDSTNTNIEELKTVYGESGLESMIECCSPLKL